MIKTSQELIDAYSGLSKSEQTKFNKQFKNLDKFKKQLKLLSNCKIAIVQKTENGFEFNGAIYLDNKDGNAALESDAAKAGYKRLIILPLVVK